MYLCTFTVVCRQPKVMQAQSMNIPANIVMHVGFIQNYSNQRTVLFKLRCFQDRDVMEMQIIFKAITGSFGHAPWWEGQCGTVRASEESVAKTTELVAALGSSLCQVTYGTLAYRSKYLFRDLILSKATRPASETVFIESVVQFFPTRRRDQNFRLSL